VSCFSAGGGSPPGDGFSLAFLRLGEFFYPPWCEPVEARSLLATRAVEFCSPRLLPMVVGGPPSL
jgi:hypothetical protein